jgi:hypothetical protein
VYTRFAVTCDNSSGLSVRVGKTEGTFTPWFQQLELQVFGVERRPQTVALDGKQVSDFIWNESAQTLTLRFPYSRAGTVVTLR